MRVRASMQLLCHLVRESDAGQFSRGVDTKVPQPRGRKALSHVRDGALGEGHFDLDAAPRHALEAENNVESPRLDTARGDLYD